MNLYTKYLIKDGPINNIVTRFITDRKLGLKKLDIFTAKVSNLLNVELDSKTKQSDDRLTALAFKSPVDSRHWVKVNAPSEDTYAYRPNKSTKEGRVLFEEMEDIYIPSNNTFQTHYLGIKHHILTGNERSRTRRIVFIKIETHCDHTLRILHVPDCAEANKHFNTLDHTGLTKLTEPQYQKTIHQTTKKKETK